MIRIALIVACLLATWCAQPLRADDDTPIAEFWQEIDSTQQRVFEDTLRARIHDAMGRWWDFMELDIQQRVVAHYRQRFADATIDSLNVTQRILDSMDIRSSRFYLIESGVVWRDDRLFDLPSEFDPMDPSSEIEIPFIEMSTYLRPDARKREKSPQ